MRKLLTRICLFLALLLPVAAQAPAKPYTSPDGDFTVAFTEAPKVKTYTVQVKGSDVKQTSYSVYNDVPASHMLMVMTREFPAKLADEQQTVEGTIQDFISNGAQIHRNSVGCKDFEDHYGCAFVATLPKDENGPSVRVAMWITAADNKLYVVSFIAMESTADAIDGSVPRAFLDSFHLIKTQ